MAAKIRCILGDGNVVAESDRNVPVAAGTQVDLGCLIGLDPTDVHGPVQAVPDPEARLGHGQPKKAQATRASAARTAAATKT